MAKNIAVSVQLPGVVMRLNRNTTTGVSTQAVFGLLVCAAIVTACAGGPQIAYESAPDAMQSGDAADVAEARALEQAESDCARQGKHAVSRRIEGETVYDCVE